MTNRLERLLAIEENIRSGRYPSIEDLCGMYSVKPRTIYEDIRILRERLGLDIKFDRARNGYFNEDPNRTLPSFDLSQSEYVFLVAACMMLEKSSNHSSFQEKVSGLLEKVSSRSNGSSVIDLERCKKVISIIDNSENEISPMVFLDLFKACVENASIELVIKPHSRNQYPSNLVLSPEAIVYRKGSWHLRTVGSNNGGEQFIPIECIESCKQVTSGKEETSRKEETELI